MSTIDLLLVDNISKENITRIFTRNGSLYYIKFDSFIIEQSYLNSKYKLIIKFGIKILINQDISVLSWLYYAILNNGLIHL